MKKLIHYSGEMIGNWTLIEYMKEHKRWKARCACGVEKMVSICNLTSGDSKSCGCLKGTHHMRNTPEYCSWYNMKDRCINKNSPRYCDYGGRGIKVCEQWISFENFFLDMGARPKGTSIGRIDNDGDYCPENCRWETPSQQVRNRRNTVYVLGEDITSISERANINRGTLDYRVKSGWNEDELFSEVAEKRYDLKSISKQCGISEHVLGLRLCRGWTMERATTQRVRQFNPVNRSL